MFNLLLQFTKNIFFGRVEVNFLNNEKKEDWALEQDLKYNRLTAFKLFAMTSSIW